MAKIKNSNIFTISLILFSLAVIFSFSVNDVSAAPQIYVNATGGNDANSGTSWQYAKQSIGNGIGAVDSNGNVTIANGTYSGTNNRNININKNVNIIGMSKDNVIIDAGAQDKVFNIQSGRTVNISNLTIRNGRVTTSSRNGGAIYNQGTLTVNNCNLRNNRADRPSWFSDSNGGAIYNTGTLTITGSTFNNNTANDYGGAIYNTGTLTITGSTFTSNSITGDTDYTGGGAIYSDSTGSFSITNTSFSGNSASTGGAIISMTAFSVSGSTFTNNTADLNGGAISFGINNLNPATGTMTITNSNFTGNDVGNNGGAVWSYGTANISNSNFTGNHADDNGGAIRTWGTLTITSCNLLNNTATSGGAISNYQGTITAHFNRIVGNGANDIRAEYNGASSSVNAENNWWGTNFAGTNPVSAGRITAESGATVDANPWLVLRISASPTGIPVGGTSNVTADLTWNSNNVQPTGGHVPDGTPITFNVVENPALGTLNPTTAFTTNGIAISTFIGIAPGLSTVNVTADNQTLQVQFKIGTVDLRVRNYEWFSGRHDTYDYNESPPYVSYVLNNGPDDATNIAVNYTIGEGLIYMGHNLWYGVNSATYNPNTRTLTYYINYLPKDGIAAIIIYLKINATGTQTPALTTNASLVSVDQNESGSSANYETRKLTVANAADIQVNQDEIVYDPVNKKAVIKIYVKNNGPNDAPGVNVTNLLPAGLLYTGHTSGEDYDWNSGIWNVGFLANGTTKTLEIYVNVTATTGTLINDASKTAPVTPYDWDLSNDSQTRTLTITGGYVPTVDLRVRNYEWFSGRHDTYDYNESPPYVSYVLNNGPDDATNIAVNYTIGEGLIYMGHNLWYGVNSATYNPNTRTLTYYINYLPKDGIAAIIIYLKINATGTQTPALTTNASLVSVDQNESGSSANYETRKLTVANAADIQVNQNIGGATGVLKNTGQEVTITITVTNNGPDTCNNIVIEDLLTGMTYVGNDGGASYDPSTEKLTWNISSLASGESTTLNLTVKSDTTGTYMVFANKTGPTNPFDWNLANDAQTNYITTV